jgi:hypothetical protein
VARHDAVGPLAARKQLVMSDAREIPLLYFAIGVRF